MIHAETVYNNDSISIRSEIEECHEGVDTESQTKNHVEYRDKLVAIHAEDFDTLDSISKLSLTCSHICTLHINLIEL